jgi:polysaccharide deacetylase 2 family uncharacterized protein YibQ
MRTDKEQHIQVTSQEKAIIPSGDDVICHFNHPEKETFEGVKQAIPILKEQGFSFVKLEDVIEK